MAGKDVVLTLEGVTLRYGERVAVENLHLQVRSGQVVGLLGANGSGKSSTLSACAGLLVPAQGTIHLEGRCSRRDSLAYRRALGYVPQELALYEEMTGRENLSFFGKLYGLRGRDLQRRVLECLHFVRLADRAGDRVGTYSGGMQRRLNLACALMHRPSLLLLDEPTVGLDIASREAIFDCLTLVREAGCAILYTTHHLDEAEALCDRLAILRQGQLIAEGTLVELLARLEPGGVLPLRIPCDEDAPRAVRQALRARLARVGAIEPDWNEFESSSSRNETPSRLEQILRFTGKKEAA
jgi:ABC-2 type transport system ATP-binding protein